MQNKNPASWFIEWKYTPKDFFEENIDINNDEYHMSISDGKIVAQILPNVGDPRPILKEQIHNEICARFAGVQLSTHEPYQLSEPSVSRHNSNGTTVYMETLSMSMKLTPSADFRITDKNGNVEYDSKIDRIKKKRLFASLATKYNKSNTVARSLLSSYERAVSDPSNELVHLYEIRDAISKEFGSKKKALTKLNILNSDWQELGRLANDAPLNQGRHRGKTISGLRDAKKDELNTARKVAKEMILAYFNYLEMAAGN